MDFGSSTRTSSSSGGGEDSSSESLTDILQRVYKDSTMFAAKCKKPDKKEFLMTVRMISIGFAIMGFMGLLAKLFFIPINAMIT
mmetsp:Transcript_13783/g.19270  ORF Transcript_13783/g.19270 Transcript_13783/m.19270 type:complete len:84 (-) Transcript_13783:88-339(-)